MANPQIDQFTQALFWKLAPWILVASAIGTFGGLAVKWLERRAIRFGEDWRRRKSASQRSDVGDQGGDTTPHCPSCNSLMVKRTARRGANAGSEFWGCPDYPRCRGTREF